MARRPKAGVAAEVTLTIRMTDNDRSLLDRLVALRAEELVELGADEIDVTAASYVRGLIRREAKAKGITSAPATPPAPAEHPPPAAIVKAPDDVPDAAAVQAALLRALEAGEVQRHLADRAGIDPSLLSKFKKSGAGLSAEKRRSLMDILSSH